ncbi:MAG: hypothetical protein WC975_09905 [Phycisphaerae bacterium]
MAEKNEEKTLKDVLAVIFSHYKLFLTGSALFMIAVMIVSYYIPVKYKAVSKFERRGDSVAESIGSNPNESFQTKRLTLKQELAGDKAIEKAIEEIGVTKNFARDTKGELTAESLLLKQNLIRDIMANVSIDWEVRTDQVDVVAVSCSAGDPKLAEQLANTLVNRYITWVGGKIIEELKSSRESLKKQVAKCNLCLADLNGKRVEFEGKYAELIVEGTNNLQERIQTAYADIDTLRRQQQLAKQKVKQIRTLVRDTQIKAMKEQLQLLKNEVDTCLTLNQMTQEHPKVQALYSKIAKVEERIKENRDAEAIVLEGSGNQGVDSTVALQLASAESEAEIITDEIDRLQKRITTYKAVMTRSVPLREEYLNITKPLEDQQAATKRWQNRLADVEMTLSTEESHRRTQLRKTQIAQKPTRPLFPPLWGIIAAAVIGGLVFGYGLAFFATSQDHTLHSPQEASEIFAVPVVGAISEIELNRQRKIRIIRQTATALLVCGVVIGTLGLSTYSVILRLGYPEKYMNWKVTISGLAQLPSAQGYRAAESIQ